MRGIFSRLMTGFAVSQLLLGCATMDKTPSATQESSIANQRVSLALASLNDLEQVDAYIKLDNKPLEKEIRDGLAAQAAQTGDFEISNIEVRFARQVITLEATLQIARGPDDTLSAVLGGDVILTFSGNQLKWLPHFDRLSVPESAFASDGDSGVQARIEFEERMLGRANRNIADAVIVLGKNVVPIDPLPLGHIEVGAALTNFPDVTATNIQTLGGVFTVAGSAILIEPAVTSIAVDLGFVPNISDCPADLEVSRSTFARQIRNREPVGIIRLLDQKVANSHFYTEISGASRSTAVVHYWFADGKPVWLEELAVEPSYRWRTWSSMTVDPEQARNWEVIVVEKATGCILHSLAIQTYPASSTMPDNSSDEAVSFESFREEFEQSVSGFSILGGRPDVALIEVSRPFLRNALSASLRDIQVLVDFDIADLPAQELSGNLQPFRADEIVCAERECEPQRKCDTGFTQCVRQTDTRDCTTCLFRNPLNNRCVNEGVDPICMAARAAQNTRYEKARSACLNQEAAARRDCQKLRSQEIRSCEIEAATAQSACVDGRETVGKYSDAGAFAGVSVTMKTSGGLAAVFSDFEIEGDFEGIRQNLRFSAALELSGDISFAPKEELGPIAACINAWQKPFEAVVVLPQVANNMIGTMAVTPTSLVTDWTGQVVTASISPTPLEAIFVENPNLLADCQIGLSASKVAAAATGPVSEYLAGRYDFEIQPTPSRIDLGMASVAYAGYVFKARPELSAAHLKFDVKGRKD